MKLLTGLVLFQTACIILLLFRAIDDGTESSRPPTGNQTSPAMLVENGETDTTPQANLPATRMAGELPGEQRLRQIVREELQFHLESNGYATATTNQPPVQRNTSEDRYRMEYIDQQIEYFKGIGSVSPQQMNDIQREIALLEPRSRAKAMRKLMRAMNSGEIKGQL